MRKPLFRLVTSLLLSAACLAAPSFAQEASARLSPAEATALREKFSRFLRDDFAQAARADDKNERARTRSEEEFALEWQRHQRKGNLLASPADLRAIFTNCFPIRRINYPLGVWRQQSIRFASAEDEQHFRLLVPKLHRTEVPMRAVVVIPGRAAGGTEWTRVEDHFDAAWAGSPVIADTVFHGVVVPPKWDLDAVPDRKIVGGDAIDVARTRLLFGTLGESFSMCSIDRARVLLDCGAGACGFGLRFATMFPDRFAGLVLRQPVLVDGLRLGSLRNLPVLLIRTDANAAVVDALAAQLAAAGVPEPKVVTAADAHPHRSAANTIGEWFALQHRQMAPTTVVIEPNTDEHDRAYWIDIVDLEADAALAPSRADRAVRLEAHADRANNTIRVQCTGVESFRLLLDDTLLDLDKPFTVNINGRGFTEQRTRSFQQLRDGIVTRHDWENLFTVSFTTSVPK